MSSARAGTPGATRVCPHCKATVLESASVCPGCRHHLRFSSAELQASSPDAYCAFSIDGTIAHKSASEHCEYCVVLDIRNERGEQIMRQVVGVGALHPGELRRMKLSVEMLPVRSAAAPKPESTASSPGAREEARAAAPPAAAKAPLPAAAGGTRAAATAGARATPPSTAAASGNKPQAPQGTPAAVTATLTASAPASAPPPAAPKAGPGGPAASEANNPLSQRLRIFRKP